jgi:hypothetical protein
MMTICKLLNLQAGHFTFHHIDSEQEVLTLILQGFQYRNNWGFPENTRPALVAGFLLMKVP